MTKKNKVEFEAKFIKADLFNNTLHIIVSPKGSLTYLKGLYELKENQKIRVTISE